MAWEGMASAMPKASIRFGALAPEGCGIPTIRTNENQTRAGRPARVKFCEGSSFWNNATSHVQKLGKEFMSTTTVNISANQVKELREKTGAPMMDCKQALTEAKGDLEQAVVLLRKRGVSVAAKKASRATSEGAVASYIHAGGKIGVLLEINCESDFVARTDAFKELLHDISMHIAASDPKYIRREDVTAEDFEREKEIYRAQAASTGKPANVVEKIVEGKMSKFYEEVCLLDQPFIKDQTISVGQLIASKVGTLGENISVRRFARFKVGEATQTIALTRVGGQDEEKQ